MLFRKNASLLIFFLPSLMLPIYFLSLMGYMHFGLIFLNESWVLSGLKKCRQWGPYCTSFRKLIRDSNADKWTHLLAMQRDCNYYLPSLKVNCNLRICLHWWQTKSTVWSIYNNGYQIAHFGSSICQRKWWFWKDAYENARRMDQRIRNCSSVGYGLMNRGITTAIFNTIVTFLFSFYTTTQQFIGFRNPRILCFFSFYWRRQRLSQSLWYILSLKRNFHKLICSTTNSLGEIRHTQDIHKK